MWSRVAGINADYLSSMMRTRSPLAYERMHLPLCKVADAPFHIQRGDVITRRYDNYLS